MRDLNVKQKGCRAGRQRWPARRRRRRFGKCGDRRL